MKPEVITNMIEGAGVVSARVCGRSMWPVMANGERVTLCPHNGKLALGRVYVYINCKGRLVAHRLTGVTEGVAFFKGDNNNTAEQVPVGNVVSACCSSVSVRRTVRRIRVFLKHVVQNVFGIYRSMT